MDLSSYDYDLPADLIASAPAEPRDSARLLVYDTRADKISFDIFRNITQYLPKQSLLVFNDTKVLPARVFPKKETGGKVEVLLLVNEGFENGLIKGIVDRKIEVGGRLFFDPHTWLEAKGQMENIFLFKPNFPEAKLSEVLNQFGQTPLPKYIKGSKLSEPELRARYQTIFAKTPASVAAPTASFHFTPEVFKSMEDKGIDKAFVTLHVGLGTFAPLSEENFKTSQLHKEFFEISPVEFARIQKAKTDRRPIIAVGTTAMRTLESAAALSSIKGETRLFIHPPYEFKLADALITNFHVPKSSLMMLVEAFLQSKHSPKHLTELYKIAIEEKFRFYSFGDSMLII